LQKGNAFACARARGSIPYSDLVRQITSIEFSARDQRLDDLLAEISQEEAAAGRGMLSVVVVHKRDKKPGAGFFRLCQTSWTRDKGHRRVLD
jgi:hypothetical protein